MNESVSMLEIRKIRDKNSLRHLNMTPEEIAEEYEESTKRFIELMEKDIEIVSLKKVSS
ncbi:MAG: hypothetical protein FWD97_03010 [Defluviitaleaceae bacterium]|nr:hypothetical protein [Defluviitaleaceae bacterium]